MPNQQYDPESGAVLFIPTKDDIEYKSMKKKVQELEKQMEELLQMLANNAGSE